jgi:hypothetical protein
MELGIRYGEKYTDDEEEYRVVVLPRDLTAKHELADRMDKLMTEEEWR